MGPKMMRIGMSWHSICSWNFTARWRGCSARSADLLGSWKQGAECLSRPSVQRRIWPAPNRSLGEQAGQREPSILEMLNHPRASIRMRYHGTERFIDQVGGLPP